MTANKKERKTAKMNAPGAAKSVSASRRSSSSPQSKFMTSPLRRTKVQTAEGWKREMRLKRSSSKA